MNARKVFASATSALLFGLISATSVGCASADKTASGDESNITSGAPVAVIDAASALSLGAAKGNDGAPDVVSTYFFEKADVVFNHYYETVDSVRYHDQSLPEHDRNDVLDGEVLAAAINFKVGALKDTQGASGTAYYDFDRAAIGFSNVMQHISVMQPTDGNPNGDVLSGEVLQFATSLRLGLLTDIGNAAGSQYFTFENGQLRYSNVVGHVDDIVVKNPDADLPMSVASAVLNESYGRLLKVTTNPGHVDYEFQKAILVANEHGPMEINRK